MKEETKERFVLHDTIISWACIIWAVASIGLMFYFSGLNQVTFAIMTFGQLFLILGIISLVRKQPTGLALTVTGLGCIIIPAINEWGHLFNENIQFDTMFLPTLLATAITVIGLALMFGPGILEDMADRRCKLKITGECVDVKSTKLSDGTEAYAPVYSYEYNGNIYTKCTEKYKRTEIPEIGSKLEFKINEKKPEDVYIEASKASKMLIYLFGISFFISGIGMLITVLSV
jgi:hypothetical protein